MTDGPEVLEEDVDGEDARLGGVDRTPRSILN